MFEGLYIFDKWNWEQKFPVVRIDFGIGDFSSEKTLNNSLEYQLEKNLKRLELNKEACFNPGAGAYFQKIISETYSKYKQKVVVLIDEYDKPILDNISYSHKKMAVFARRTLRNFYGAIKNSDKYLKFVFITGVSKFSKLNLFSGLNNLKDITVSKDYATITGYTQSDLEYHFADYLEETDKELVKKWYNGYNYLGEPIYNPFDILLFFSEHCEFSNYWWETGNPAFLIEKLKEEHYFLPNLETIEVSKETLNSFDIEHIDLVALLWQTGYLTFDKKLGDKEDIIYKMKIPNLEIQKSLNSLFFNYFSNYGNSKSPLLLSVKQNLLSKNFEGFKQNLITLFANIPYENYVNNTIATYEGYYASVLFAFLSSISFIVKVEEATNLGRIDMTMIGNENIFIIEFKVDKPTEVALHQIKSRKYYQKYQNSGKDISLIGIHFNSEKRIVENLEWEPVKDI